MTELDGRKEQGLIEEAAAWFARMRGPDAEASRPEFEAWLARGALHRAAYNRASEIFAMGKFLAGEEDAKAPSDPPARRHARAIIFAAAAAILLVVLTAGWLAVRTISPAVADGGSGSRPSVAGMSAELRAGDEDRSVRLADGSLVRLAADTILDVTFSGQERRLRLQRGLALFQVAHETRPFVVFAGGGSVTAHGTVFEVSLSAERRVSVRLIEGVIDVKVPGGSRGAGPVLKRLHGAGAISFMADTAAAPGAEPTTISGAAASSPSPSARDFDGIRLADLIAMANRHLSRPIRLADAGIGDKRISGRFSIDDADLLSERIALLFGLVVDRSDPAQIVLRR